MRNTVIIILSAIAASIFSLHSAGAQDTGVGATAGLEHGEFDSYPDLTLTNMLQGKIAGLQVRSIVHGLGNNVSDLYIRGQHGMSANTALVIIDGVERPLADLIPEEIESIVVLKDATAKILYGARAANGVVVVTTKKGKADTDRTYHINAEMGITSMTRMPEWVNAYEYANLYNEACMNDGLAPYYTQEQVDAQTNLLNNFQLVKAPVTYTVTTTPGTNGSIALTGDAEDGIVEEGQDAAYTVTADSGYVIDTLAVDGVEVAEAKGLETYSGTVEDVNANVTIAATFKLKDSGTITNKKDLWDAIEDARAILKQTDKYTAASLEEYGKIIDAAYAVYESDNADADDIAAAIQSLKDGLSVLVEQGGGTTDPGTPGTGDDKPGTGSGGDSSGNGKPQGGSGSGKDTVKAAQTGDDTNVMIWIIALAAAAAAGGAVLVIRKRSTR